MASIGQSEKRKEAGAKVTGEAKYTDDFPIIGHLCARLKTSPYHHAKILSIDSSEAASLPGVRAVVTGEDCPFLCGPLIEDRPPLARDIVRYAGEPIAIVVAVDEATAALAVQKLRIEYEVLPHLLNPAEAAKPNAPILHNDMANYQHVESDVFSEPGSNISSRYPVRKGDMAAGWAASEVIISESYVLPPSDHLAMEVRTARASINKDGAVAITSSTQAPFSVKKQLARSTEIPSGQIEVRVPFVGGGFGGKAPVTVEFLAYLASAKAGGAPVRLTLTRAEDIASMPCRMGLRATVKLGATRDGKLQAMEARYTLDHGAYADIGPYMAKAMAADCTGPYRVENLDCEVVSVYTNHTFATSYRGFAHEGLTFCVERSMDVLAYALQMEPLELRRINALMPGQYSPTQVPLTVSNLGDLHSCIDRLKTSAEWVCEGPTSIDAHTVRASGMACFWKAANPPTNAISGAMLCFNPDGSVNLNTGAVEMGSGNQSLIAQMLADRLGIGYDQVHVALDVDTRLNPEHYKTVASLTGYMVGKAVLRAADDALHQLRTIGAQAFCCEPEDIEIRDSRVYARQDPETYIHFKDIVNGYKTPTGLSLGNPVLARGGIMLKGLSPLNPTTGAGRTGPAWTLGIQAVEVELDTRDYSYRVTRAATAMDVGRAVNPVGMCESIRGGMAMGLSMASQEALHYDFNGQPLETSLRLYKLLHIGEAPHYSVELVETPQADSPCGLRSMSEHGIIGMAGALANALSAAAGVAVRQLPITPESLWRAATGGAL